MVGARLLRCLARAVSTQSIVASTETINGRPHYVQAQLRWEGAARELMTSVIAFAVDAALLRSQSSRERRDWLASVQQPSGCRTSKPRSSTRPAPHLRLAPRGQWARDAG